MANLISLNNFVCSFHPILVGPGPISPALTALSTLQFNRLTCVLV